MPPNRDRLERCKALHINYLLRVIHREGSLKRGPTLAAAASLATRGPTHIFRLPYWHSGFPSGANPARNCPKNRSLTALKIKSYRDITILFRQRFSASEKSPELRNYSSNSLTTTDLAKYMYEHMLATLFSAPFCP